MLMRLEGELNTTLLFEHGRCQPASMLWVARILLGRLCWERLAFGQTMKAFAKHYHKEVTHNLLKIHDLVELVEPPLGGLFASTSVGHRWNDKMELDVGEEEQEPNVQGGRDSPDETNIGLG